MVRLFGAGRVIIACYSVWNDLELLKKSIDSVYDQVDVIAVVDGAYIDFPHEIAWSTDGTKEYVKNLPGAIFIENTKPWYHQYNKRSQYFIGEDGDCYLIIDADEILKGSIKVGETGWDVGICWCRRQTDNARYKRARFIKHVPGIHYAEKHYWIRDVQNKTVALLDKAGDNYTEQELTFKIIHMNHERDFARETAQKQYYQIHGGRERRIKEWT